MPLNATGTPLGKLFAHLASQRPPNLSTYPPPPKPPFAFTSPPALQVGPGFHVPVGVTVCTPACALDDDEEAELLVVVVVVVVVGFAGVVVVVVVVGIAGVVVVVVVVAGLEVATLPAVSDELDEPVAAGTVEDETAEEV